MKKEKRLTVLGLTGAMLLGVATETFAIALTRGPYVQMGHFTNQATIVWYTDSSSDSGVDYGLTGSYGAFAGGNTGTRHEVTVAGLQPGTSYFYRVRSAGVNLATNRFKSAKAPGQPFRIAMWSDSHYGNTAGLAARMALYEPDLMLAAGDITDDGVLSEIDNNAFSGFGGLMKQIPAYWTPGNHDTRDDFAACREVFTLPGDERNYWFEYADAQIVSLNAEGLPGTAWLDGALAASAKPWKIVFFHEPARSPAAGHGEEESIRDQYVPVMERHGVQLALAGHNHFYWRSIPLNGVTHLITGRSGDRTRDLGDMPCYSQAGMNGTEAKSFAIADFDGPFMQIRGIKENGDVIDDMVLDRECSFVLDGALDASAVQVAARAGGQTIWAAVAGRYLYLATEDAGEGRDAYVFVATASGGLVASPWAKAGSVMAHDAFVADENDSRYSGWFTGAGAPFNDLLAARSATPWCNGAVLEGVLDLQELYGEVPAVIRLAAAAYATADGGALAASAQCPEGNGNGDIEAGEFVVVNTADLVQPFALDGAADHDGYLVADHNGMKLWAAVHGETLYVATWAAGNGGGPNDHFIFVSDTPGTPGPAPWAKAGQVAFSEAAKPFLADEGADSWVAWHNGGVSARQAAASVNSGQLEGTLNLVEVFGSVPETLYIAVAPYATADAGALYAPSQVPEGDGNGNIDAGEFVAIPVAAIRDANLDGTLDILDPARGFVMSDGASGGNSAPYSVNWSSQPGRRYRVQSTDDLKQPFANRTGELSADQGQFTMTYSDAAPPANGRRFYRVQLLDP
ncbi:MAG TPA: metallophosphoesterase family protein [Kiritimatiellia bacterium]|nr:metallophosphoesterase family protein [Kiritimatiellia bacterium]HRZ11638.1 metallophosphoesterase family protein [Kiritimatiellia bacterium]HSA16811.1 metallophosphoesterase family protein [Kiritimatiellia bacterium]